MLEILRWIDIWWECAADEWETIRDKEGAGEHDSTEVGESWLW